VCVCVSRIACTHRSGEMSGVCHSTYRLQRKDRCAENRSIRASLAALRGLSFRSSAIMWCHFISGFDSRPRRGARNARNNAAPIWDRCCSELAAFHAGDVGATPLLSRSSVAAGCVACRLMIVAVSSLESFETNRRRWSICSRGRRELIGETAKTNRLKRVPPGQLFYDD